MKTMLKFPVRESWVLRAPPIYDATAPPRKTRIAVFGSFMGRVKTPEFFEMFMDEWRPSLCLMATFGQRIPTPLINYPSLGFYNFHHSGPRLAFIPRPRPDCRYGCRWSEEPCPDDPSGDRRHRRW